jgi:hypothetical protein
MYETPPHLNQINLKTQVAAKTLNTSIYFGSKAATRNKRRNSKGTAVPLYRPGVAQRVPGSYGTAVPLYRPGVAQRVQGSYGKAVPLYRAGEAPGVQGRYGKALPLHGPRGAQRVPGSHGKAALLQAWSGPEGARKLRFPDLLTTARDGGKVVSPTYLI